MARVNTIYGELDEAELLKLQGGFEDDNERVTWVQYHLRTSGEMVHRSAAVHLKKALLSEGDVAALGHPAD